MEFPATGGVMPHANVSSYRLLRYNSFFDYVILVCEIIFLVFLVYFIIEEFVEIIYFGMAYFSSFWNWIDLFLVIISCITVMFSVYEFIRVTNELKEMMNTDPVYRNFDGFLQTFNMYNRSLAILVFFAWFKVLKYLTISDTMYQMQATIHRAAGDIACFSVIFFIILCGFANLGHLLFGSQVRNYKTFTDSMLTLLRGIVGDFNYREIEEISYLFGSLFLFSYTFLFFFILINMFIAILVDAYAELRNEVIARGLQMNVWDLFNKWFIQILRKLSWHTVADKIQERVRQAKALSNYEDIKNLLRRCGYSELEIDLFFTKYGIDENSDVSDEEMQKILSSINTIPMRGVPGQETMTVQDYEIMYEKMNDRVSVLEDSIISANNKVDIILNKLDALQQIKLYRRATARDND